ncbi:MAG: T9SS type A sorting domain-containing protein, partial [Saprospiraceae bacterium]
MRDSDKTVLAATHGRGLITTDVFSAPAAVIIVQPIAYEDQPAVLDGSFSVNAQSYKWSINGDFVSVAKTLNYTFENPGTYSVELIINDDDDLKITRIISVLPYLPAPYQESESGYTGDFESSPEHFAAYTVAGTAFSRGSSTKPGKEGTHSGANAWILGKDVNLYANNTRAELYTPQYDLTQPGLFELKFWSKFAIQNRNDGFQVEYSTDSGASWQQLGTRDDPAWYNYLNSNLDDGAWPKGKAYFTNIQLGWTNYVKDISFLAGEDRVSFRFVFRSDRSEQAQGIVIDDFEITKYQGPLQTTITVFAAQYDLNQDITLNWTTGIEYQAKQFILERSFTGFGFEHVATLNATGVVSTVPQEYSRVDQSLRDLVYYRIKVINDNPEIGYHHEFYSDTIVVRRDVEPDLVHKVLTNPFTDRIMISFSSMVNQPVTMRLFDISGRLVREQIDTPNSVAYQLDQLRFTPGIYILSVQVGENEPSTHKLFTNGG